MSPQKAAAVIRKSNVKSALEELRNAGYAVIIWTPSELKGVSATKVEDRSIEIGYEVIHCLQ